MYSLRVSPPTYQWKILGAKPVHFLFNMDFERDLVNSYDYSKPSMDYAIFYV